MHEIKEKDLIQAAVSLIDQDDFDQLKRLAQLTYQFNEILGKTLSYVSKRKYSLDESVTNYILGKTKTTEGKTIILMLQQIVKQCKPQDKHTTRLLLDEITDQASRKQYAKLTHQVQDKNLSIQERLEWMSKQIGNIVVKNYHQERQASNAEQCIEDFEKFMNDPKPAGIPIGFTAIDQVTLGIAPGELHLVAARPGQGKSQYLLNIALNMAKSGRSVLFLSLEMPQNQVVARAVSNLSNIPSLTILGKLFEEEDKDKLIAAYNTFKKLPITIADCPNLNTIELTSTIEQYPADVVIIDYLGIMRTNNKSGGDWEVLGHICEEVRGVARNIRIPIYSAVQLNRPKDKNTAVDGARISRSDIITQTADVIIGLEESNEELGSVMTASFIKNRKGCVASDIRLQKDFAVSRLSC